MSEPNLYCIKLTPIRNRPEKMETLGDLIDAFDQRTETFETFRQRLCVFQSKKAAERYAKKLANKFWKYTVREVRFMGES